MNCLVLLISGLPLFSLYLSDISQFVSLVFSSVQLLVCVRLFTTPWTAACQAPLSPTISWSLLILMSTESVTLSSLHAH